MVRSMSALVLSCDEARSLPRGKGQARVLETRKGPERKTALSVLTEICGRSSPPPEDSGVDTDPEGLQQVFSLTVCVNYLK